MISVIICTYNHCESLKATLESIIKMGEKTPFAYEVIVVDNNSNDRTREVVGTYYSEFEDSLKYVFEKEQGLSKARNAGLLHAKGEIVAFTDDDCTVDQNWLNEIHYAFHYYNCDALAGKINLMLDKDKSKMFAESFLKERLAAVDYGDCIRKLDTEDLVGANMSFRLNLIKRIGYFSAKAKICDDTDFSRRLTKKDFTKLYSPYVKINHYVDSNRLSKKYFYRQSFEWGQVKIYLDDTNFSYSRILFWEIRALFINFTRSLKYALLDNKDMKFLTLCKLYSRLGSISQLLTLIFLKRKI